MKTFVSFILFTFLIFFSLNFTHLFPKNITEKEKSGLLYMLEEEKLAKDVYTVLYEKWQTKQFGNIKESEKIHVQKIQELLNENQIASEILPQGKFRNKKLQNLYNDLISKGNISEINALQVGATIEDVDIFDLGNFIRETNNIDIQSVYRFLECGSRNHIRAFSRGLEMRGETYKAQYISSGNLQKIIAAEHERCGRIN